MDIDYEKLYLQINIIYEKYPAINKLTIFDFKTLPDKILKTSPLTKLNKLINKCIKQITDNLLIIKLNEYIAKTNQWLIFTYENYQRTINNDNFKKLCNENKIEPNAAKIYFNNQNIIISNTQLKKQNFIYNKYINKDDTNNDLIYPPNPKKLRIK